MRGHEELDWNHSCITKQHKLNHISVDRGLAEVKVSVVLVEVVGAMHVARSQGKPHRKTAQSNKEKTMELMKAALRTRDIGASSSSSSLSMASASFVASLPASLSSLATSVYSPILSEDSPC